jgi:hypothetical protein
VKLRAAICAACGGPIYVEMADPRLAEPQPSVQRKFQAAAATHFQKHPEALRARAWGDADRRACYTLDEALGSVAAYRLWLASHRLPRPPEDRPSEG